MAASRGLRAEWRRTWRFAVGLFVAYAILVQALAAPLLRAKAADLARLEGPLAILCLSEGAPGHDEPGQRRMPHGHGLDCCLPGLRLAALDAPALVASPFLPDLPAATPFHRIAYWRPAGRAPPAWLANILQPRAPPASIA